MSAENDTVFRQKIAAILTRQGRRIGIDVIEEYEVVGPPLLTVDDQQALEAMTAAYDKHLGSVVSPDKYAFLPSEDLSLQKVGVSNDAILKKCLLLTQLQNLMIEVLGHKNFSDLSISDQTDILVSLWIFLTVCKTKCLSPATAECLNQTEIGALLEPYRSLIDLMRNFGELNLDENELRFLPIFYIYIWISTYAKKEFDFGPRYLILITAISNYERSKYPAMDCNNKDRFDNLSDRQCEIFNVLIKFQLPKYLLAFSTGDIEGTSNLDSAGFAALYSIFFA